jgi:hypothetical protein
MEVLHIGGLVRSLEVLDGSLHLFRAIPGLSLWQSLAAPYRAGETMNCPLTGLLALMFITSGCCRTAEGLVSRSSVVVACYTDVYGCRAECGPKGID